MGIGKVYNILGGIDRPMVDRAMADALPTADAEAAGRMVEMLLERGRPVGLTGLVQGFGDLPEAAQEAVVAAAGRLESTLRKACRSKQVAVRLNAIEIVRRSANGRYACLLVSQLHSEQPTVVRAAAAALRSLAEAVMADGAPADRAAAVAATADACTFFHRYRRRDVLLAAATLAPTRDPALLSILGNRHVPSHGAMVELIRQADDPPICRAMLALATERGLVAAVSEGLDRTHTRANTIELLRQGSLVRLASVRRAIRRIRQPRRLLPTYRRLAELAPDELRFMPWWIDMLNVPGQAKAEALGHVAALGDGPTRLLALRKLRRIDHDAAKRLIGAICFDAEPRIARRALDDLVACRWDGLMELTVRLVGSNHAEVRAMAERQLAPVGFERLWRSWQRMTSDQRRVVGRALIKIDGRFHHRLAGRMHDATADLRLRALAIARTLGQETYFEQALLGLARDADARVASSAVKALAAIGESDAAAEALEQALDHADDRVRANAIEALEQLRRVGQVRQRLLAIASGRGNRSRANAIKAIMSATGEPAVEALSDMLTDTDARHRTSALWVTEQLRVLRLVDRVADVARTDPRHEVRRRALRVLRHMAADRELARAG